MVLYLFLGGIDRFNFNSSDIRRWSPYSMSSSTSQEIFIWKQWIGRKSNIRPAPEMAHLKSRLEAGVVNYNKSFLCLMRDYMMASVIVQWVTPKYSTKRKTNSISSSFFYQINAFLSINIFNSIFFVKQIFSRRKLIIRCNGIFFRKKMKKLSMIFSMKIESLD